MTLTKFVRASAATIGALALATQVNAADLYSGGGLKDAPVFVPVTTWTGFYIGTHLGADWATLKTGRNVWDDGFVLGGIHDSFPRFGGDKLNSTGAFGGGQLGYNWQTGSFLLGFEVDLGGVGNESEVAYGLAAMRGTQIDEVGIIRIKSQGGFYGDVTGRLGYTWGPALLYAKGGFAWLDTAIKTSARIYDGTGVATLSHNSDITLDGWTVGGGAEYMLNPNWTIKVEYLHFDYNSAADTWGYDAVNTWRLTGSNLTVDTVKLGFNYFLTHGYGPLK